MCPAWIYTDGICMHPLCKLLVLGTKWRRSESAPICPISSWFISLADNSLQWRISRPRCLIKAQHWEDFPYSYQCHSTDSSLSVFYISFPRHESHLKLLKWLFYCGANGFRIRSILKVTPSTHTLPSKLEKLRRRHLLQKDILKIQPIILSNVYRITWRVGNKQFNKDIYVDYKCKCL